MIKVGDKVFLKQAGITASVTKIVTEKGDGTETSLDEEIAGTRLFLDSEYGPCKVYLHDQGNLWISYLDLN